MIARTFTLLLAAALFGCATTQEGFGDSVRHMIGAQIHNPVAAENPSVQPAQGLAGDKATQAMKAYRAEPKGANTRATPDVVAIPVEATR